MKILKKTPGFLAALLMPVAALAQEAANVEPLSKLIGAGRSGGFNTDNGSNQIYEIISTVIRVALSLVGAVFLALMVYAGFKWMTAGGDSDKVETAKGTITRLVIGLAVVLLSYAITVFVTNALNK